MVQISFQNTRDNMKIVIETPNIIAAIIIRSSIKTDVKLIHNDKTRIKSTTLLSKFNEEKKRANPIMKKPMGINKNDIFSNTLSGSIRAYNILYAMTDEAIITRPTRKQIILYFISFSCLKRAFIVSLFLIKNQQNSFGLVLAKRVLFFYSLRFSLSFTFRYSFGDIPMYL